MLEGEYKIKKKIMLSAVSNFIGATRGRLGPVDVPCIAQNFSSHPEVLSHADMHLHRLRLKAHWKRPRCWERLRAGERGNRG